MSAVTVAIATYNEAETIDQVLCGLQRQGLDVVLVDNNSPDMTAWLAMQYENVTVLERCGLCLSGAYMIALIEALQRTSPEGHIVQMDAGMTHDPGDVSLLLAAAKTTGAGLVIGSRFRERASWRGHRTLVSRTATLLMRAAGVRVSDATSGFRCWSWESLKDVLANHRVQSCGHAFQLEMLYWANRVGAVIAEVPIEYRLTNSSFQPWMVVEAMTTWWRLVRMGR